MNKLFGLLAVGILTLGLGACGAADIGEECDEADAGSKDPCVDNAVCTPYGDKFFCYKICTDQADCNEATEACNGVTGTNVSSCQPKD